MKLAVRYDDGLKVVCKQIKPSSVWHWHTDYSTGKKIPYEIHVMRLFAGLEDAPGLAPHPNLIRYLEHYEMDGKFMIVMEYLGEEWIDLYDYVEIYGPVKERIAVELFRDIVETICYLHSKGFYHNDIKGKKNIT